MSNALEHEVKIIINVVSDLQKAAREIDQASEALGGLPRDAQRAADSIHGVIEALTGVANRARGTKDALKVDSATINSWKALRKQMQEAVPADAGGRNYRNASTATDDIIAAQGSVGKNFSAQLRAQMQEREKAFQQQAQAAVKAGQEERRQLDLIAASHAKNAAARRAAAESDRQAQWTSIQNAKARASEEARVTEEIRKQAQGGRGYRNASTSIDAIIGAQEASGKDFSARLQSQMQEREQAFQRQAQAAIQAGQEEKRQLDLIGASHAKNADARRAAAESDRQAQWTSIQNAKARASEEARVTAELRRQADARRNADRASVYATPRTGSFLGQGQTAGLSAADTTWARESEVRMKAAREALAAYDKQLNTGSMTQRTYRSEAERLYHSFEAQDKSLRGMNGTLNASQTAMAGMLREQENAAASLPRLRYALYDVAATAGITSAAIAGVGAAVTAAFASRESAFTNVERTLSPADFLNVEDFRSGVAEIRDELEGLSLEIPKSFQDLSAIATLGNQLGIGRDDLTEFTEVVAQFSTVSGMTAEATALAFGRITNILGMPISEARSLASSIELVGVNSAATDKQIIALVERLGATATRAGFTSDQIVGLSGSLASLGVAPERAQGVFERYFGAINTALAEGGEKAQAFAYVTGRSVEELGAAVRSGGGFDVFRDFISGLQSVDTVQLTEALDQLGLSGIRSEEVIGRIAQRMDLLASSFRTASMGAAEATELQRQFGFIADDLASKWTFFLNAVGLVSDAVGSQMAPAFGVVLDVATSVLAGFAKFAESDIGGAIIRMVATVGALVAGIAGIIAPVALAGASFAAFKTAIGAIPWAAISTRLFAIRDGAIAAAGGMRTMAGATAVAATALKILGRVTVILAAIQLASELIFNFGGAMQWLSGVAQNVASFIGTVFGELMNFIADVARNLSGLAPALGDWSKDLRGFAKDSRVAISSSMDGFANWASTLENADTALGDFGATGDDLAFDDWMGRANDFAGGLDNVGDAAGSAAEKIRTLVDYANDLSGVFSRAFDIRFGSQQGMDTITSGWRSIAKAADDAREAAEEHRRTLASMGADRSIKQYWLSVAENYGDELRASKLRAELAEMDADMAKEKKGLAEAQDKASMSLDGNSEAAIANRASLLGLVGNYQEYLKTLAASGASQATLEAEAKRLRGEFIRQATQMGFNRNEVERYATSFDDMALAVNRIPRNITIAFNANPALQALAEFEAAARQAGQNAGAGIGSGIGGGVGDALDNLDALRGGLLSASDTHDMFMRNVNSLRPDTVSGTGGGGSGLLTWWNEQMGEVGQLLSTPGEFLPKWFGEQLDELGQLFSNPMEFLPKWFGEQMTELGIQAPSGGRSAADGLLGGLKTSLDNSHPLQAWADKQPTDSIGRTLGDTMGWAMSAALSNAANMALNSAKSALNITTSGGRGYAAGGYTGNGGTSQVAGVVHGQEYVMSAKAVRNAGGPQAMENYHRMFKAGKSPATPVGVGVAAGPGLVDLSAASIQALSASLAANLQVVLPGAQLAGSVGAHNVVSARRGAA